MNRRTFIYTLSLGSAITSLSAQDAKKTPETLKLTKVEIKVGLKKPLKFLHVSDSHIVAWDERSPLQEISYRNRIKVFFRAKKRWEMALDYSKKNNLPMLNTGDVIDFITDASLDFLRNEVMPNSCVYAVGNHEFSRYCGFRKEKEHDEETVSMIQSNVNYDISFSSHIVEGINFLSIDNSHYQFSQSQLEKLETEIKRGLPIIALFHIPIYSKKFFKEIYTKASTHKKYPVKCSYLVGVPDDKIAICDPKEMKSQIPNEVTKKVVKILSTNPLIKGILCGHVHQNVVDTLPNGAVMTASEGTYHAWAQEITIY